MSTTRRLSLKEDAKLAIGATGAVVATDQVIKSMDSEENQFEHILKAGVRDAVAIGAYKMLRRAELDLNLPLSIVPHTTIAAVDTRTHQGQDRAATHQILHIIKAILLAIGHRRPLGILRILQLKGNVMTSSAGDEAPWQQRSMKRI
jgi:hypothetical protein